MHRDTIRSAWPWLLGLVLVLVGVWQGLEAGRRFMFRSYGGESAREKWQLWRDEASRQAAGEGPVRRREVVSPEFPGLVLLRDHYGACLAGALLLSAALYGSFAWFLHGALHSKGWRPVE